MEILMKEIWGKLSLCLLIRCKICLKLENSFIQIEYQKKVTYPITEWGNKYKVLWVLFIVWSLCTVQNVHAVLVLMYRRPIAYSSWKRVILSASRKAPTYAWAFAPCARPTHLIPVLLVAPTCWTTSCQRRVERHRFNVLNDITSTCWTTSLQHVEQHHVNVLTNMAPSVSYFSYYMYVQNCIL